MEIFVLGLSRLVPVMFLASLTLVGSRYLHDVLLRTRPHLARWGFAAVSLVGLLAGAPYLIRAALIVSAQTAVAHGRWIAADALFARYDRMNGSWSEKSLRDWAFVRMNAGDWRGAEEILRIDEAPSAQVRILAGLCRYNSGDVAGAAAVLRTVPNDTGAQLALRDYLLGRIAQRSGSPAAALRFYERSAAAEPTFLPSIYHGARLLMLHGREPQAAAIVSRFLQRFPMYANNADVAALREAIARHGAPPEKEFVIVSD